jgi:hypothetical protein
MLFAMDTPPAPDEIREMREELHRLIDRLTDEALVARWRLVWRWVTDRRTGEGGEKSDVRARVGARAAAQYGQDLAR